MNNNKIFYKQANFYVAACAFALALAALCLYAAGCPSEFNGGAVSGSVVAGDVVAIICAALAVAGCVVEYFMPDRHLLGEILKYRRFCLYIAFAALIYAFLSGILAEYSLLGTILYPIVSGTVGDPVDPALSCSYFGQLICTFVALICALTAALMQKSRYYKAEKNESAAAEVDVGEEK